MSTHTHRKQDGQPGGSGSDPDLENYYQLLGVPFTASRADITRAYRTAMKRVHPDRVRPEQRARAEGLAKDLNHAYRTLSNATERLAYDQRIRPQVLQDEIMQRYVGGFAGPGVGRPNDTGQHLKRPTTQAERRDLRRSERAALFSLFSAFLVLTLGAIGLLLVWALVAWMGNAIL